MVTNFLLESDIAHTDQQIAESLGLAQRQVRAILEARLCKDFITEAETPNSGVQNGGAQGNPYIGGGSAWYRICPDVLSAAWYRLTQTERALLERLKSVQEIESYVCSRCGGREFDSLRAVSLYSQTDGLFHCDICEDVLQIRENKIVREKTEALLSAFHCLFEPVKEKLESMSRMFVPRPIVIKKTVHEKLLEQARTEEAQRSGMGHDARKDFSHLSAALSNFSSVDSLAARSTPAESPEWIREAQSLGGSLSLKHSFDSGLVKEMKSEDVFVKKAKLEDKTVITPLMPVDIKTVIEAAHSLSKKEEIDDKSRLDENVLVSGITYSLQEVRNNDLLIDRMTDQEYEAYDRLVQRLGFQ
jgi:transcription initiation factor IIE alpha subunit